MMQADFLIAESSLVQPLLTPLRRALSGHSRGSMRFVGTSTRSGRTTRSTRRCRQACGGPRPGRCPRRSSSLGMMPIIRCVGSGRRATSGSGAAALTSARRLPASSSGSPSGRLDRIWCGSSTSTWASSTEPAPSGALPRSAIGSAKRRKVKVWGMDPSNLWGMNPVAPSDSYGRGPYGDPPQYRELRRLIDSFTGFRKRTLRLRTH